MKGLLSTCFGLFLTTAATALELHLTTYGQEPDPKNWASADNYKYMLTLTPEKDFITVRNPKHLDVDRLQAERIALGQEWNEQSNYRWVATEGILTFAGADEAG